MFSYYNVQAEAKYRVNEYQMAADAHRLGTQKQPELDVRSLRNYSHYIVRLLNNSQVNKR